MKAGQAPERHPPVIMTWDARLGRYTPAGVTACVARWASTATDHAAGDLCARTVFRKIGDTPLCRHHCERVWNAGHPWREEAVAELHRNWEEGRGAAAAELEDARRKAKARRRRASGRIYYARRTSDGLIKIGTTQAIQGRLGTLRGLYGEMELLLTHEGGSDRETEIHQMFGAWQSRGEWFHPGRPLLEWILQQRRDCVIRMTQVRGTVPLGELQALLKGSPRKAPPKRYVAPRRRSA